MLLRSIGAALLSVGAAHGFKNSSPFVLLSTQQYGSHHHRAGIQSANIDVADIRADLRAQ